VDPDYAGVTLDKLNGNDGGGGVIGGVSGIVVDRW